MFEPVLDSKLPSPLHLTTTLCRQKAPMHTMTQGLRPQLVDGVPLPDASPRKELWVFDHVPNEILERMLKTLHDNSNDPASFTNALCVCRQWHDTAVPVLYKDIVLTTSGQISNFIATATRLKFGVTKNLTLRISPRGTERPWVQDPSQMVYESDNQSLRASLKLLTKELPSFPNMESFSFYVTEGLEAVAYNDFEVPMSALARLVRSLPTGLRHLEIDTKCSDHYRKDFDLDDYDIILYFSDLESDDDDTDGGETDAGETDAGETDAGETDKDDIDIGETDAVETNAGETHNDEVNDTTTDGLDGHLCPVLAQRSKTLQTMRLHVGHMCADIYEQSDTLVSLTLNLLDSRGYTKVHPCVNDHLVESEESQESITVARRGIVTSGLDVLSGYPLLEKFLILDSTPRPSLRSILGQSSSYPQIYQVDALFIRDLLLNQTTIVPQDTKDLPRASDLLPPAQYTHQILRFGRDLEETPSNDISGLLSNMEDMLEGPAWHSAGAGTRFPDAVKLSSRGRSYQWHPYTNFVTREEGCISGLPFNTSRAWSGGVETGDKWMHVSVTEGVDFADRLKVKDQDAQKSIDHWNAYWASFDALLERVRRR